MASDSALYNDGKYRRLVAAVILCLMMMVSAVPSLSLADKAPELVAEVDAAPVVESASENSKYIQVNNFLFDPLAETPSIPDALSYGHVDSDQKAFYIVQFNGPITDDMKRGLSSTGVELLHYINYNGFIVSADGVSIERAKALSSVRWSGTFEPAYKLSPRLSEQYDEIQANAAARAPKGSTNVVSTAGDYAFGDSVNAVASDITLTSGAKWAGEGSSIAEPAAQAATTTIEVLITTFESSWVDEVSDSVFGLGGNEIMVSYKMWGTVRAIVDKSVLTDIARLPGVMWIDRQSDPHIFNDIARWVIQSGDTSTMATPIHEHGIYGTGQVVTLADTGIDYDHAAFYDPSHPTPGPGHRKVTDYYVPAGASGDNQDNGINHGSHTAGTIGGDDGTWHIYDGNSAGSNGTAGPHDGQAFDATLQMQDISVDGFGVGIPSDMHDLFQPALDRDSWIHSNSWGGYGNQYITEAAQTDDFLWDNQEFIVCFAAGNSGPYLGSINPFAVAKNVIAVGATENGAYLQDVTDFSSRGPCADSRLKPDVMAPGDYIWSVHGVDPDPTQNDYWQLSGTSMATPTVAGAATLVRQYFMDGYYPTGSKEPSSGFTPSAALVKAMLINGAAEMTGVGAYDNGETRYPNDNQGWGRVLLDDALYFQGDDRSLLLTDNRGGIGTGTSVSYDLAIGDTSLPVEITLVWTDYPGVPMSSPALVNDLDLVVTDPSGDVFRGNAYSGYHPGQSIKNPNSSYSDHVNNVESVLVITSPEAGLWSVTVSGHNVPNGPQPFAIVMTGGIATDKGVVGLDKHVYQSSATVNVRVVDSGLNQDSGAIETTHVNMTSWTETTPEVLTLTETGPATAVFAGSIPLQNSPVPIMGDGILQVLDGDNITAEYYDSNDGIGGRGPVYAHAYIDDVPPVISAVSIFDIRFNRATVSWQTSENADSLVMYGATTPPTSSGYDQSLTTSHEIDLRNLAQNTTYYLYVESTDEAGNTAIDDNGSAYYTFRTTVRPPSPASDIEWPTFHNNVARVGSSPSMFTPPLEEQWRSPGTYNSYWAGPVVSDGIVFTTCTDGFIRARDAFTGDLIWSRMLGATNFYTSPASVSDGVVYTVFDAVSGPGGTTLYALDELTGEEIWSVPPSSSPDLNARVAPGVADGLVFAGAWTGEIIAVDAATGTFEWTYQTNDQVMGSVVVSGGQVFAATYDGRVLCLDEFSGGMVWSKSLSSGIYSCPMAASGFVYVATVGGTMYCLDDGDGSTVWSTSSIGPVAFSTPVFDGSSVYVGTDDGLVFAFDAFDGSVLWSTSTGGWIENSLAYANGYLYVVATDGLLRVMDAFDGSVAGSYSIGTYATASPAVSDGWVWVEDDIGGVYAFFGVMPVAVRVVPSTQSMEVVPGMVVDYPIDVTNLGTSGPDLFDANISAGAYGWSVGLFWSDGITPVGDSDSDGLPDTGSLPSGSNVSMIVRVSVPGSAGPGQTEESIVDFISNNDPTVHRSAVTYSIVPPPGVEIGPRSYFPLNPGETAIASLTVENTGAFNDTFDITASSENGWAVGLFEADGVTPLTDSDGDLVPDTGTVLPFGSVGIVVQVQVPSGAPMGMVDRTAVSASSSIDPGRNDTCLIVIELAAPPSSEWPTFHNNNARAGMSPSNFLPPLQQQWVAGPFYHNIWNGPAMADGVLFTTDLDGYLRAFDAFTGEILWDRLLGDQGYFSCTPTVSSGVVYVTFYGTEGGSVYALEEETGSTIWMVGPNSGFDFNARTSLAVSSGLVIGCAWEATVFALDASDGSLEWRFNTGGTIYGSVAVSGGLVYFGTTVGMLYALDEITGELVWSRSVSGDISGSAMCAQGMVFVATFYGTIYAFDALTGSDVWSSAGLGYFMYVTPAYDGTAIYIGSSSGTVNALDTADGSVIWTANVGYYVTASVGYANGYVYCTVGDGTLRTLDAANGAVVDVDPLYSSESTSAVAISDGWVWVQDMGGYVYAFQGLLPVGLRLQPTYDSVEALPGTAVDHTVTVTNIGTSGNDTFDVTVTLGSLGWTVELFEADGYTPLPDTDSDGVPDTGPMSYEQSVQVVARVTVPSTAAPGDDELSRLRFTSSNDEAVYRDASMATMIPPPGVLIGPNAYDFSAPGKSICFYLVALNTGALTDVFDLMLSSSMGWPAALYQYDGVTPLEDTDGDGIVDTGGVDGLGIFELVVNVTIPGNASDGTIGTIGVTAYSSIDPAISDQAKLRVEITGPQSTQWPTFQHDNARSGVAPGDYSLPLRKVWTYFGTGGASFGTSPVVANGIVYYTTTSGCVMAVDAASGEQRWASAIGQVYSVLGTPAVYDSKVFVPYVSESFPANHLSALDALTGAVIWTSDLASDPTFGTPVASGGVVYIGDDDGTVYAFDTDTGASLWTCSVSGPIYMGPSLIEGRIVVATAWGSVCSIDLDGHLAWSRSVSGSSYGAPSGALGMIYVATWDGYVYGIDSETGATVWSRDIGDPVYYSAVGIWNGAVYVTDLYGSVHCMNSLTGASLWTVGVNSMVNAPAVINNGTLFVPTLNGSIALIDCVSGASLGSVIATYSGMESGPAIADGYMFVTDNSGTLTGFAFAGAAVVEYITVDPPSVIVPVNGYATLQVFGIDRYGNPVPYQQYVWEFVNGSGTLFPLSATANEVLFLPDQVAGRVLLRVAAGPASADVLIEVVAGSASRVVVSPTGSSVDVNTDLQFAAVAYDGFGNELVDVPVVWSTTIGTIGSDGLLHAGTVAGSGVVEATVGLVSGSAEVEVLPGAPDRLEVVPPTASVVAGGMLVLDAKCFDEYANEIADLTYDWSTSIGSISSLWDNYTALLLAGNVAGSGQVTVSCEGLVVGVPVEVTPGELASLVLSPSEVSVTVGGTAMFEVAGYDAYGNEVHAIPVEFTVEGDIGTVNGTGAFVAGTTVGSGRVVASSGSVSCSVDVSVVPGALDHISVTPSSSSAAAGGSVSMTASGFDQYGNAIPGLTYSWSTTIGSISPVTGTSHAVLQVGESVGWGNVTVTCGSVSVKVLVHVTPAALASVSITPSGASVAAEGTLQFSVACFDVFGNPITGLSVTFEAVGGIGSVASGGLFTAGTSAGSGKVVATVGGMTAEAAVSVAAGAVDHITVTPTTLSLGAGGTVTLSAVCYDQFGNELSGGTLTWSATIGTVSPVGSGFQAVFQAGASVGTGTVTVSQGSVSRVVNVAVAHGALASILVNRTYLAVGSGDSATVEVTGYDAYGNEIPGLSFTWSYTPASTGGASGTLSPRSDSTAATFAAEKAGKGTIVVTSGGESAEVQVTIEGKASTLSSLGPPIAIAVLLLAVMVLLALYLFVWRKKMVPPAQGTQ